MINLTDSLQIRFNQTGYFYPGAYHVATFSTQPNLDRLSHILQPAVLPLTVATTIESDPKRYGRTSS